MRRIAVLLAFMVVAGCATTASEAPKKIRSVEGDQFSQDITINGAQLYINPFGGTFHSWFIRSWVNKVTHRVSHQLYVEFSYSGGWRFYQTAADDTATSLPLNRINTHVGSCAFGSCTLEETVVISLEDAVLRARTQRGYPVKISAKSGDALIVTVSPEQISLQLEATEKYARSVQ